MKSSAETKHIEIEPKETASANQALASKASTREGELIDVAPDELFNKISPDIASVMASYIDTADVNYLDTANVKKKSDAADAKTTATEKPIWLEQPLSFWGHSLLQKQILTLVENAASLDEVEKFIRLAHARGKQKEPNLQATLMKVIKQAVIGLDQTLYVEREDEMRNKVKHSNEGMAERLLKLHKEFYPSDHEKALSEARKAALQEDEKEKQKREKDNTDAIEKLFSAFIENDEKKLPEAIGTFKTFIKSLKPDNITNNQYYLNLLHLIFESVRTLLNKGRALDEYGYDGGIYGTLAKQFCTEIIGSVIETDLPPRVRQILRANLYEILNKNIAQAERDIDISGALFRGDNTAYVLGKTSWFHEFGACRGSTGTYAWGLKDYYEQLLQHSKNYSTADTLTPITVYTGPFNKW